MKTQRGPGAASQLGEMNFVAKCVKMGYESEL